MRYKTIALMLALTFAAWAQTANSNPQPNSAPEKAKCSCCDKTAAANAKDGQSCARHRTQSADGKQIVSCCGDKNGKSCCAKDAKCMKGDKTACCSDCNKDSKDNVTSSCCKSDCGKDCGKNCRSDKSEKASKSCCRRALQS
jgi:hypothetical protein